MVKFCFDQAIWDLTPSMINPLATPLPSPFIRSVVMNLYYKYASVE